MHTHKHTYIQALVMYGQLQGIFPKSHYIVSQMALARYNMRDFSEAQQAFELILKQDPYRFKIQLIFTCIHICIYALFILVFVLMYTCIYRNVFLA